MVFAQLIYFINIDIYYFLYFVSPGFKFLYREHMIEKTSGLNGRQVDIMAPL